MDKSLCFTNTLITYFIKKNPNPIHYQNTVGENIYMQAVFSVMETFFLCGLP